jgi:hypothetical protein
MASKPARRTLPKDLDGLLETAAVSGDYAPVHAALERCLPDARGGYGKGTLLMHKNCTFELARWAIARGTDINAGDTWGYTPLHESARSRYQHRLTPAQLIELGADVHRKSRDGLTPLHSAADGKDASAVRVLLDHGADLQARNEAHLTPLEYALVRMSSIDFPSMVIVAKTLLEAGAEVSRESQGAISRAAEAFEFHRGGFAADLVGEVSAACESLCAMFRVEPPPRRVVHDGTSPIIASAETVGARHRELWNLLVPSKGACDTIQGEVIRISGRIADEWFRNGGVNWDRDYAAMARAFYGYVASHHPLAPDDLAACMEVVRSLRDNPDSSERLMEWAVEWVRRNPDPIRLEAPSYKR